MSWWGFLLIGNRGREAYPIDMQAGTWVRLTDNWIVAVMPAIRSGQSVPSLRCSAVQCLEAIHKRGLKKFPEADPGLIIEPNTAAIMHAQHAGGQSIVMPASCSISTASLLLELRWSFESIVNVQ